MRSTRRHRLAAPWLMLVATLAFAGCGSDFGATVQGTVTLDGQALPQGTVTFHPVAEGAAAYGSIQPHGAYKIQTGTNTGLVPGEYRVTVVAVETEPSANPLDAPSGRRITPERYQNLASTDLRFHVKPGSNSIDLALTTEP